MLNDKNEERRTLKTEQDYWKDFELINVLKQQKQVRALHKEYNPKLIF